MCGMYRSLYIAAPSFRAGIEGLSRLPAAHSKDHLRIQHTGSDETALHHGRKEGGFHGS